MVSSLVIAKSQLCLLEKGKLEKGKIAHRRICYPAGISWWQAMYIRCPLVTGLLVVDNDPLCQPITTYKARVEACHESIAETFPLLIS